MTDPRRGTAAGLPWPLIAAACWATFVITGSGTVRAPFLLDIARDLSASLFAVANLFSFTALAWGIASLFAGAASDRFGRRPVLVLAHLALVAGMLGVARADGYAAVAFWTLVAGAGGGGHMGVIFAAVSDRVAEDRRGSALGWIITGQSLSFVAAVPLATWLGAATDWRGVMTGVALADLPALAGLWATVAGGRTAAAGAAPASLGGVLADRRVLAALAAGVTERVCFGIVAVYFATLLQLRHGLALAELALPLALMAAGNLAGNAIGGRLADRAVDRTRNFALASLATAATAAALFAWDAGKWPSVALGFAYAFANALGRPSIIAILAAVPDRARGAVLGLNITCASVGWITAAAIGGLAIERFGIGSLAPLAGFMGVLGAALALAARRR